MRHHQHGTLQTSLRIELDDVVVLLLPFASEILILVAACRSCLAAFALSSSSSRSALNALACSASVDLRRLLRDQIVEAWRSRSAWARAVATVVGHISRRIKHRRLGSVGSGSHFMSVRGGCAAGRHGSSAWWRLSAAFVRGCQLMASSLLHGDSRLQLVPDEGLRRPATLIRLARSWKFGRRSRDRRCRSTCRRTVTSAARSWCVARREPQERGEVAVGVAGRSGRRVDPRQAVVVDQCRRTSASHRRSGAGGPKTALAQRAAQRPSHRARRDSRCVARARSGRSRRRHRAPTVTLDVAAWPRHPRSIAIFCGCAPSSFEPDEQAAAA